MDLVTDPAIAPTAVTSPAPVGAPRELSADSLLADRYRIKRRLGAGGMGTVFAAHDTLTDQPVAIKLVAGHRTEVERAHLREEVRATISLTHRNIARTHTLDEVAGEIFIVMELLEGETLATRIARGPIPRDQTLAIIHQLIDALAEAHAHNIVHCDVKPANIMCCPDGRVVLMDFGLARRQDPEPSASLTGTIRGTPAYMAPEVVSGRRADARADIYAVGLILFEMLTGEPPFKARSVDELLDSQLYTPIDTRTLDDTLAAAIRGATAKDPAKRYSSLAELRAAFLARPRRKKLWLGAAAAVFGLVAGFAAVRVLSPRGEAVADPAPAISASELELRRMLKAEILASMDELKRRACACPNDAECGRRVLTDLVALGKRTQLFDTDIDESTHTTSAQLAVCLLQTGISNTELLDLRRRVVGLPVDTSPRESAW